MSIWEDDGFGMALLLVLYKQIGYQRMVLAGMITQARERAGSHLAAGEKQAKRLGNIEYRGPGKYH
jgi:hypothetical protein